MPQGRTSRPRRNRSQFSPRVSAQALEARRLLSASVAHHVLLIDGTRHDDSIVVTHGRRAVQVAVNGVASEFSLRSFGRIRIRAGKGDDVVTLGTTGHSVSAGAGLSGGRGDDTLSGGDGNDRIGGGAGDDVVSGQGGRDRVYGGNGADTALGGTGDDRVYGNAGNDSVDGGAGD